MALSIILPDAVGLVGPGYSMSCWQDTPGPIPNDDWLEMTIYLPGTSYYLSSMSSTFKGSHFAGGIMGVRLVRSTVIDGAMEPLGSGPGVLRGLVSGGTVNIYCIQRHADNTVVDFFYDSSTWLWDPVGGLGELLAYRLGGNSDTAAILAAVVRTFPPNA